MRTAVDCVPCFLRQALDAARMASDDPNVHQHVMRRVLARAVDLDMAQPPPAVGRDIHRIIRDASGQQDPYRAVKQKYNAFALERIDSLRARVEASGNPLETAARLAIAGNIIDFGVSGQVDEAMVEAALRRCLHDELAGDASDLTAAARSAETILYLADNAGEIVFDRLLIEQLGPARVTVAVKGGPVINDATRRDAEAAGLTELCEVIDNGSDAPGTLLGDCSDAFRRRFEAADLVIAKGQGNWETLSETDRTVIFLLQVKCPVIAGHMGLPVGSLVVQASEHTATATVGAAAGQPA